MYILVCSLKFIWITYVTRNENAYYSIHCKQMRFIPCKLNWIDKIQMDSSLIPFWIFFFQIYGFRIDYQTIGNISISLLIITYSFEVYRKIQRYISSQSKAGVKKKSFKIVFVWKVARINLHRCISFQCNSFPEALKFCQSHGIVVIVRLLCR